ncbi:protein WFDC10B [Camelus dromedarius]|uniref:Protein WFDC10B n=2 Tax=Camelus TaxID=9836 RepID=A0A8B8RGY7_CAMFR|nr:protein WFDC10B [Camelus bactrianus]XP_010976977.1 protein WFDC10B [Camelus dromedarius]XP_032317147.1 protein WFDC10B [Camelus ferus]
MRAQALLPTLLLCVLLLQAQGGHRNLNRNQNMRACMERPDEYLCSKHCSYFLKCPTNTTCCTTFCGNVCMNIL